MARNRYPALDLSRGDRYSLDALGHCFLSSMDGGPPMNVAPAGRDKDGGTRCIAGKKRENGG